MVYLFLYVILSQQVFRFWFHRRGREVISHQVLGSRDCTSSSCPSFKIEVKKKIWSICSCALLEIYFLPISEAEHQNFWVQQISWSADWKSLFRALEKCRRTLHFQVCSFASIDITQPPIWFFKFRNRNDRTICEICLKETLKIRYYVGLVSLLLLLNRFHPLRWCFHCWF